MPQPDHMPRAEDAGDRVKHVWKVPEDRPDPEPDPEVRQGEPRAERITAKASGVPQPDPSHARSRAEPSDAGASSPLKEFPSRGYGGGQDDLDLSW